LAALYGLDDERTVCRIIRVCREEQGTAGRCVR
jgi:hypothetical protein